ncbi:uncharacterized protein LOC129574313 [Sitodiplosis mosellana]|uniref:uncharacterized protein LOC129574313 n=1 Tax=Sitodiplosis mosellana TaxID=263140 RepID=UPI002443D51A|nr:uncharacterized protein LOC129574313 [Sitodiplosis mosellana]XP_055312114.1 uncharacterized protein LOC129574313 [Sitodiplosis mosellana]XP_055312115.1 uncharacterized protein LOC129574313 [Sitodiplosis mosellana]XP_055312116.1 uncharacterized protein LOC129574313 [Sitodiplosis mosellana]XP_055312117.1 uncharacterized protein LOC129574313 [Sitodiplosis mosellana]XP_055312118.1 uncharacterized protein LOC129574313 [Sitodiplosis mosellana]
MGSIIEFDTGYLNTTAGKYKISCLTLGAIGLVACSIARVGGRQYVSLASFAFLVTAILLLILICKASLRQSSLWLKVEVVVCVILTICYIVASIDIFRVCWYYLFDRFDLGPFIGSLIATICSIFATLTYASDTALKCRESSGSGSTSNV